MKENTTEQVNDIIGGLSKESAKDIAETRVEDASQDLRLNVMNFFNSRIKSIDSQEKLKQLVQNKLEEKLETEELTVAQLKDLFVVLSRESTNSSQDILKVAHPAPGQSAFADDFSRKKADETSMETTMASLSTEDQRKLDLLYRFLEKGLKVPE